MKLIEKYTKELEGKTITPKAARNMAVVHIALPFVPVILFIVCYACYMLGEMANY